MLEYLKEQGWYIHFKNQQSTTEETRQKMKISSMGKRSRRVTQYDLNENIIYQYTSMSDAASTLSGNKGKLYTIVTGICECCNGNQKTAYGYKWKYSDDKT